MAKSTKKVTFQVLAQHWLTDIRIGVKESTFTRYHRYVEKYILPHLGALPVREIDCFCINRFGETLLSVGGMHGAGLSPKTVTDILCVVKSILKFGRLSGYPCPTIDGIRYPQRKQKQIQILSGENRALLEKFVLEAQDNTHLGILLSLYTGLRIGELCGLRWGDIDLNDGILSVRRTVERIADLDPSSPNRTKVIVSEPKTSSSLRVIPLTGFLMEILRSRAQNGEKYILTGKDTPAEPHTVYMRYRKLMRAYHLEGYSFHALRHTFATRCMEVGFDTKTLSEILGHANISTTLAIYVHPSLEQKRLCMEKLMPTKTP